MKNIYSAKITKTISTALIAVLLFAFQDVSGQTELISNGGFETGTGTPFNATDNWTNFLADQTTNARNTTNPFAGDYRGVIGLEGSPYQNTGHSIALGDTYTLNFQYAGAANWDLNTDQFDVTLYYLDGATPVNLETVTITPTQNFGTGYDLYSNTFPAVTNASAVGNNLHIRFESLAGASEWAAIDDVSLTVPTPAMSITSVTVTDATCPGTGSILLIADGTAPYTYSWTNAVGGSGSGSGLSITGLDAGIYNVTITDSTSAIAEQANITVGGPAPLTANLNATLLSAPGASDGAIDLTITGGIPSYGTITWTKDGTFFSNSEDISGLSEGLYEVTISDTCPTVVTASASILFGIFKQLYLSDGNILDRIDPVNTSDNSTATTSVLEKIIPAVVDNFNTNGSYSGNNGTVNWATDWVESGDSGGATGGDILVTSNALRLGGSFDEQYMNGSVYRQADLTNATSATLSFDFSDNDSGTDFEVDLEISNNGGTTYTTLEAIDFSTSNDTKTYDITSYISSNTRIRFNVTNSNELEGTRYMEFDNVRIDYTIPDFVNETFTQSPALCSDFIITSGSTINADLFVNEVSGTITTSSEIKAVLRYGTTIIANLANAGISGGVLTLSGSPLIATIPSGSVLELDIINNDLGVSFTIDYDSATDPSKITIQTDSYINIQEFKVYTDTYPDGSEVTELVTGETYYVRTTVTDPFGYYDITSGNLAIIDNDNNTSNVALGAAQVVHEEDCTKVYEYAFVVGTSPSYSFESTVNEGFENQVSDTATLLNFPVQVISAVDDLMTISAGTPGLINLLTNDIGDIDPSTFSIISQPTNGTLQIGTNGEITYLPNGSYTGIDTVVYEVCSNGSPVVCDQATLTITIEEGINDPCAEATKNKIFYLPFPEDIDYLRASLLSAASADFLSDDVRSILSIKFPYPRSVVTYDHWEDGYEIDITIPEQSTTEVWGDGDLTNGIAPGHPTDILHAGASILIDETFQYNPRIAANIEFDGKDKLFSSADIAVSKVTGDAGTDGVSSIFDVQNAKTNVYDTTRFGQLFVLPFGEDVTLGGTGAFKYTGVFIRAATDGTTVNFDYNGDGTVDISQTLNEGEVWFYDGTASTVGSDPADVNNANDIKAGGTITASDPVGVDLLFGGIDTYGTRNLAILPGEYYGNTYYTPVYTSFTSATDDIIPPTYPVPVYVFFTNTLNAPITINWTSTISSGSVIVPSNGSNYLNLPEGDITGYKFESAGDESFTAIAVIDSDSAGRTYDWSFNLISEERLTTFASIAWAPGSNDLSANYNPVWITPTANTTIYIKYDGDLTDTAGLMSPCNIPYDLAVSLNELQAYQIYDTSDNDQTGLAVYTCDGTSIAAVWGQDPAKGGAVSGDIATPGGSPAQDVGYVMEPRCLQQLIFANDDFQATLINTPVDITLDTNDVGFLCSLDPTSIATLGLLQPSNGTVTNNGDGTITYTPNPGFTGVDIFEYQICSLDYPDICDVATVRVPVSCSITNPGENDINGTLFVDIDSDGIFDIDESGQSGVTINLYEDINNNGLVDFGDTPLGTDVTDAQGNYSFSVTLSTGTGGSVNSRVSTGSDDAEETATGGTPDLTSSDLELVTDGSVQIVGMRFNSITIPQGAVITSAYIEFETDETNTGTTNLIFSGENVDNAATFTTATNNISGRTKTSASVNWNTIPSWSTVSEKHQTPDLSPIIQEIVNRTGWTSNNNIAILVEGTGERTAESYNGESANAPLLVVQYNVPVTTNYVMEVDNSTLPTGYEFTTDNAETATFIVADVADCENNFGIDAANLVTVKTLSSTNSTVNVGDTVEFTITVTNNGPSNAINVSLTDLLPTGLIYVSNTPSLGNYDTGTGVWDGFDLLVDESATLVLEATVDVNTEGDSIQNLTTAASSDLTDPTDDANDLEETICVSVQAGTYSVQCDNGSAIVLTGIPADTNGTWSGSGITDNNDGTASFDPTGLSGIITVTYSYNNGNGCTTSDTADIEIADSPDISTTDTPEICNGSSFDLATLIISDANATGASYTYHSDSPADGTNILTNSIVSPTIDTTYYVLATTTNACTDELAVTVTVQAQPNAGTDGLLTICEGEIVTEAQLFAQLGGGPDTGGEWTPALAGADIYTYTVAAIAPCTTDATAIVTVTEQALPYAGENGTLLVCDGSTPSNTDLFNALEGSPQSGGTWSGPVSGVYTYTVDPTSPCTGASDTATVSIEDEADLSLTKGVENASGTTITTAFVNDVVYYRVTLTNDGPCDATGVTVQDRLPTGVSYISGSSTITEGTFTVDGSNIGTWDLSSLTIASGTSKEIVIAVNVGAGCSDITNFVQVMSSDQPDPDSTPANNN